MTILDETIALRIAEGWDDYTLIDTGGGQKLEDFGELRLIRPEAQAMWPKAAPRDWSTASASFEGTDDDDGPGFGPDLDGDGEDDDDGYDDDDE